MTAPRPAVAYLVSQYPALSHAFIETEVEQMRALGARVETFSVRACPEDELRSERARCEAESTTVLQDGARSVLPRALGAVLRKSPGALPATLRTALRSGPPTLRSRVWQVFYLVEALLLWWHMRCRGIEHVHVHFSNNGADVARLAVALGRAVDGPDSGWSWSISVHGPTEFEDATAVDLGAKVRSAAAVACVSDFARSQVMRLLPPDQWHKLAVVGMAVDIRRFPPPDVEREPVAGRPLRVLTVGRLVPEKGSPVLIDAIELLQRRGVAVQATIVGAGPLTEHLRERVADAGLAEAVDLRGPVGQDDLPALYADADVFCLPSFAEGLPVVLMEAMAAELPVVTTAIAGIPELVKDRVTGLVVTAGRADLLADALETLTTEPTLARDLALAGREAVKARHDPEVNARRLLALIAPLGRLSG